MIAFRIPRKLPIATAAALSSAFAALVLAAAVSAAPVPREQLASCMEAKHYQMPPTKTELRKHAFTPALQRCLTKLHVTRYTAKELVAFDTCLINHHAILGKTPKTSSTYQRAKTACIRTLSR